MSTFLKYILNHEVLFIFVFEQIDTQIYSRRNFKKEKMAFDEWKSGV